MSIQVGLVGLPNVGKSTLFNALTKSSIPTENYPFCTIDPHIAITEVPDPRLSKLGDIYKPKKTVPAIITFVDIAGLIKGAASGEGLGNQFLSHIREVDLILHLLRCFEDPAIMHTGDTIAPLTDYDIVISELILKDLESIEKRQAKVEKLIKASQTNSRILQELNNELTLLQKLHSALDATHIEQAKQLLNQSSIATIPLLSTKKMLIIANIAEKDLENNAYTSNPHYQALIQKFGAEHVIPICTKTEYELSQLPPQDVQEMMGIIGLKEQSIDTVIRKSYDHLDLITFFTCAPKEVHAWPIKKGITVRTAAGEIHSDLQRGFICAEVFNCEDLFELDSEAKLKEQGKIRTEGQDYLVKDGDILYIKFNV